MGVENSVVKVEFDVVEYVDGEIHMCLLKLCHIASYAIDRIEKFGFGNGKENKFTYKLRVRGRINGRSTCFSNQNLTSDKWYLCRCRVWWHELMDNGCCVVMLIEEYTMRKVIEVRERRYEGSVAEFEEMKRDLKVQGPTWCRFFLSATPFCSAEYPAARIFCSASSVWTSASGAITAGAAVEVVAAEAEAVPESPLELLASGVKVAEVIDVSDHEEHEDSAQCKDGLAAETIAVREEPREEFSQFDP
ncbi:hypothetical protein AXG93_2253s1230 [Marchantia polymorpha subsp. ruderalis]|uniref:Uncharacterized protein n=1 Tax=Marchantia polymorpha subsp. ruderalis TaxID=1480154 RepID=A0A176VTN8_MARPO|nr:hypothetical protein AXG93_2253s1230 [Marchantia polymorpha subsp. ruderalis]